MLMHERHIGTAACNERHMRWPHNVHVFSMQEAEREQGEQQRRQQQAATPLPGQPATAPRIAPPPSLDHLGGSDPDLLVGLDEELKRRLEALGLDATTSHPTTISAFSPGSASSIVATSSSSSTGTSGPGISSDASSSGGRSQQPYPQASLGAAVEGNYLIFEEASWPRGVPAGLHGQTAGAGAAAVSAWEQAVPKRRALGVVIDPWSPLPSESAIRQVLGISKIRSLIGCCVSVCGMLEGALSHSAAP